MTNYAIANILSGVTACFTVSSSWVPDKRKSYILQIFQCVLYAAASVFFGVYSSAVTMLLCAFRNYLASKDKFTRPWCIAFCVCVAVIGLACNNAGLMGLVPLAATVQYAVGTLISRRLIATKWNILINLSLWVIYDIMVKDFISLAVDCTSLAVTIAAIIRISRFPKQNSEQ